ncbi:hypothetical protein P7B02_04025 [Caulobacter segnis]|uniref:hypothetical protein n=1 Tax=Caulobacter segnis TaxID=88688 RepID=UPI00240F1B5D|nr:hypothetical protein [Caulobacter segnis]MDG2520700.1 hypothetical protein [Caulobacter segnis]
MRMDHVRQARIALTCLRYVRDAASITRGERDAHDAFILSTISNVSAAFLNQATENAVRFATADSPLPDEVLRPISINALAQSLGMPFETVRRRVGGLRRQGLIEASPAGVVILSKTLASPAHTAMVEAHFERAQQFYEAMKTLNALPLISDAPLSETPPPAPPVRAVSRAVSDYFLRFAQPMIALCGNLITAAVLAEIILGNTEEMDDAAIARWLADAGACGRPVKLAEVAEPIGFSRETARRHANLLEERGLVTPIRRGFVAVAPPQLHEALTNLADSNLSDARRFFATIHRFGVLARWEAERRDSGGS